MKKEILPNTLVKVGESGIENAGRGVFAVDNIQKGQVIEECPVLVLPEKDYPHVKKTMLRNYYFMWGDEERQVVICFGYGSMCNHSYKPNATYEKDLDGEVIRFIAIKDIDKNEEITVNYNFGNPDDKSDLWIESVPKAGEVE